MNMMPPNRRILVVNPNINQDVSALLRCTLQPLLPSGFTATVVQPAQGPIAIQTLADRQRAEPLAVELLAAHTGYDAYVMACFEDIALDQARKFLNGPVVGAVEASVAFARLTARRFAVVTTVETAVPGLHAVLQNLGAFGQCSVRAAGIGVTEAADPSSGTARIDAAIILARAIDGAEAIILGSAGLAGRADELAQRHGIRVIDAMGAAIKLVISAIVTKEPVVS